MIRKEVLGEGIELYLGDCRDILPTLGKVDCIVTDPPYGMAFRSNHRTVKHDAIINDRSEDMLRWACEIDAAHSKYIFCRWDNIGSVPKPRSCVTWVKNNWSMGDLEHEHGRQTEVCLFYPGDGHFFPNGRPPDVISAPRTSNEHHPTEKPVQLMSAVIGWTRGVVVDPFCGSGSTLVAAVQDGRDCIGIEMDPKHFETALRRVSEALSRPRLFIPTPAPKAKQEAFDL